MLDVEATLSLFTERFQMASQRRDLDQHRFALITTNLHTACRDMCWDHLQPTTAPLVRRPNCLRPHWLLCCLTVSFIPDEVNHQHAVGQCLAEEEAESGVSDLFHARDVLQRALRILLILNGDQERDQNSVAAEGMLNDVMNRLPLTLPVCLSE
jgi:hypothetical protein